MQIWIIVALTPKQGISKNNAIPWHSKKDLQFLKKITSCKNLTNSLLMGRKTFQSLKSPLPNRHNIVVSSTNVHSLTVATTFEGIQTAKQLNTDVLWIFGGTSIYNLFLTSPHLRDQVDGIVITRVPEYECDNFINADIPNFIKNTEMKHLIRSKVIDTNEMGDFVLNIYTKVNIHKEWLDIFKENNLELYKQNNLDNDYLNLVKRVLEEGELRNTRNGETISKFSEKISVDLSNGFPLLTTKKVFFNSVIHELLWFLRGDTNSKNLEEKKVNIWKGNTTKEFLEANNLPYEEGIGGPIYGFQWRHFGEEYKYGDDQYTEGVKKGFDQVKFIIDEIKRNPNSRRLFLSGWNPNQLNQMCLPPCHVSYQFYVNKGKLSCQMYQRSADVFLGLPFNIASTALLTHLIAKTVDLDVGKVHICIGDTHIYTDHLEAINKQVKRYGKEYELPRLVIERKLENIEEYMFEDIRVEDYECHSAIRAKMLA